MTWDWWAGSVNTEVIEADGQQTLNVGSADVDMPVSTDSPVMRRHMLTLVSAPRRAYRRLLARPSPGALVRHGLKQGGRNRGTQREGHSLSAVDGAVPAIRATATGRARPLSSKTVITVISFSMTVHACIVRGLGRCPGLRPATVQQYARNGRIPFDTTPGGHRRFDIEEVRVALALRSGGRLPRRSGLAERGVARQRGRA